MSRLNTSRFSGSPNSGSRVFLSSPLFIVGGAYGWTNSDMSFARATVGTYTDANGDIQTAPIDTARFDYGSGSKTLLIEGPSTNLVSQSVATAGNWLNGGATLTDMSLSALGTFPGLKVASNGATHHVASVSSGGFSVSTDYTLTLWYKGGSSGSLRVLLYDNSYSPSLFLDLTGAPGNIATVTQRRGTVSDVVNTDLGGGIYKLSFTFNPTDPTSSNWGFGPNSAVSGEDVIILGAQIEAGTTPTSYIETTGSAAGRAADISSADLSAYDLSEGVWIVLRDVDLVGVIGPYDRLVQLDDGNNNNKNSISYVESTSEILILQNDAGATEAKDNFTESLPFAGSLAVRFGADKFAVVRADGTIYEDTNAEYVAPNVMYIAANSASGSAKPASVLFGGIEVLPATMTADEMKDYLGL